MSIKIALTKQEKDFLNAHFSKKFFSTRADDLELTISDIVKAYNNMDRTFTYETITNDSYGLEINYNFDYNCRQQADFVSVDINIDDYIYRDLIKNKRIRNKYDLYGVTAEVSDFIRNECNREK